MKKLLILRPQRGSVFSGGCAGESLENGGKVIIVRKTTDGGDLADFHFRMFSEKGFCFFYAQISNMFCDTTAIILGGNFIEKGLSNLKMGAEGGHIDVLSEM